MISGKGTISELGTSQGSVISPLLANIYLNTLERLWEKYGLTHSILVRYEDDTVIICKNKKNANHALNLLQYIICLLYTSIFFGLMLTADGPRVLEYNARFGDPEAQVVLPRMKNDIIDVMEACVDGKLDTIDLQFEDNAAVCVVLASDGYPVAYEKGFEITGLEKFEGKEDYFCFHAGTKFNEAGKIVTNGGRVLGITATGADLKEARKKAYEATEWVNFANKYMRHDIGKAIDEA